MSDADLVREASDPTTPAERLRELYQRGDVPADILRLNPSLPLDLLDGLLSSAQLIAWHNPAVPLLLMIAPLPWYRTLACRALALYLYDQRTALPVSDEKLESLITQAATSEHDACRRLGHRFAGLFGFPWPERAP